MPPRYLFTHLPELFPGVTVVWIPHIRLPPPHYPTLAGYRWLPPCHDCVVLPFGVYGGCLYAVVRIYAVADGSLDVAFVLPMDGYWFNVYGCCLTRWSWILWFPPFGCRWLVVLHHTCPTRHTRPCTLRCYLLFPFTYRLFLPLHAAIPVSVASSVRGPHRLPPHLPRILVCSPHTRWLVLPVLRITTGSVTYVPFHSLHGWI